MNYTFLINKGLSPKMTVQADKKVQIMYFAALREQRGLDQETIETSAATASELYAQLQELHGFTFQTSGLQVAVNDKLSGWDAVLQDNDSVAFLTPVAGG